MGEFDFLRERKDRKRIKGRKPRCMYCRYFNKIPDHQLENSPSDWSNKGICWYRKEVLKQACVVNKYWQPMYNCAFDWKGIYKGE